MHVKLFSSEHIHEQEAYIRVHIHHPSLMVLNKIILKDREYSLYRKKRIRKIVIFEVKKYHKKIANSRCQQVIFV